MPNVGAELASVPFGKMIYDMASAIARSQVALDKASIQLVKVLASTTFDYVPDIVEVLQPNPRKLPGVVDSNGNPVTITGVKVDTHVGDSVPLTLLQAGVNPTFYAFTNSTIDVKMSITSTQESSNTFSVGVSVTASADFLFASGSVTSHCNFASSQQNGVVAVENRRRDRIEFDVNNARAGSTTQSHDAEIFPGQCH